MHRKDIFQSLFFVLIFFILQIKTAFPQDTNQPSLNKSIKNSVKEAIKETDREKEEKQAQLILELKSKLNNKAKEWIVLAKREREKGLNKLQHEDWELGGKVNYPVPFDYFLRSCDYAIANSDLKTNSLFSPYKANVSITERLFVEGIHSDDAVDIKEYYYTLSRVIILTLEYKQNKFVITNTEYLPFNIKQGWQKN